MITTKPYKDIVLEFDNDIDKKTGKRNHIFTVETLRDQTIAGIKRKKGERWNPVSVTGVTGVLYKELSWWASGEALKKLGWFSEKKIKELSSSKEEYDNLLADAMENLSKAFDDLKKMSIESFLKRLNEAYKAHKETKEEAGDIGTAAHEWTELFRKGKKPKIPEDKKVKNCVLAYLKWIDENKVKSHRSEFPIYSKKHDYAGIVDDEATVNGEFSVVDLKSSSGIYNDMRYQIAAYQGAIEEMGGKKHDTRWLIQLGKLTGEFHAVRLEDFKKDFDAFIGALAIKRRELELKNNNGRNH